MSFLTKNYNRRKIAFKKEKAVFYFLTKEKYLDFVQGIAVNSLGHAHPKLIKSLKIQSKNFGTSLMLLLFQRENCWQKKLLKILC